MVGGGNIKHKFKIRTYVLDLTGLRSLYFQVEMLTRKLNLRVWSSRKEVCIVEVISKALNAIKMGGIPLRN